MSPLKTPYRLLFSAIIALYSLHVQAQEYRTVASGNWNALGTWQQFDGMDWMAATSTPTNASGAITVRAPHTVSVTANVNLDDVTIEAGATVITTTGSTIWTIDNGTFGVKIFGTFNANFSGGSFGCCGSVSVESGGVVNMNAGGSFFGPTVVQEGGTVNGNTAINLGAGALVNNGTWTMNGTSALTTTAGGSFTNNGLLTLRGYSLGGTLTNNNIINWVSGVINGTGNIQNTNGAVFNIQFVTGNQLQVPFTNQLGGTVNQNGSGTFNVWSGTTFTNAGTLNLVSANWLTNGAFTNSGTIDIPAGRLLTFASTTNLNAGTSFTGTGSITSGSTTNQNFPWTNTTQAFTLSGGTWNNSAGNPTVFDAGSAFNWTGGTLAGAEGYSIAAGLTAAFSTTGAKTLNSALTNNGTINWSAGNVTANGPLTNNGTINWTAGNLTVSNTLTNIGTINWSGGLLLGAGSVVNSAGAELNISATGASALNPPLTNAGTITYTGAGLIGTQSIFNGPKLFTNSGTLNINSGTFQFNNNFTNSGSVVLAPGTTMHFQEGTYTLAAGTTISGAGTVRFVGGTATQNFPWSNSTHHFWISGGTWNNNSGSPLAFEAGSALTWEGGILGGAGGYTVHSSLTVPIATTAAKTLSGPFTNNGTINWTAGNLTVSSTLTNNGTVNWSAGSLLGSGSVLNSAGAELNISATGASALHPPLTNAGTITYTGAGPFGTLSIFSGPRMFTNSGTLNINSGTFRFNNNFTNIGAMNVGSGATMHFQEGTFSMAGTINNAGTISGAIPSFTGPTFTNNGSVTLTSLPFAGTAAQTLDGTGSITNLTLNNANGLTLGGAQTVTGTLTLTNGRITLGNHDLVLSNTALAGLVGGNATNHIVTNGTGAFMRNLPIGGANYPFPIGTGASYLPVTLSNSSGPAERFGARVANDVYMEYSAPGVPQGPVVQNDQVEHTWTLSEQTEGGNQATVQLQWNAADEGANFDRANSGLHAYNGSDWVALALGAAAGSDPYTRNATGVSSFREFTVADGESTLPFSCPGGVIPGMACDDEDACTTNDVVNAECDCVGIFQDSDNDGTCNADDGCPNDANKTAPGACGCGVADVPQIYYVDADGDGFGAGAPVDGFVCIVPPGHVTNNTDCNDANATVYPGAPELCDELDNNCNGQVDELTSFSNGLVAQWLFNGNLNDRTANGNNGSAPSGASYTTGMDGVANGAFQFGSGRYVLVPDHSSLALGTGDFTYSVWLNWSAGGLANIFDKGESCCAPYRGLQCFVDYPSSGVFHGRNNTSKAVTTTGGLGNNTWHHIVYTRSGTTMRVYVNGVLNNTTTHAVENITTTVALNIGRNSAGAGQFYNGRMDNLRLYNRALTAQEITDLRIHELAGNVDGVSDVTYYTDADGDGYGDPATLASGCSQPPGTVLLGGDCDDTDENIFPGATEVCDGLDNDCANGVDDGLVFTNYWPDTDGDGFGDASASGVSACAPPEGHVTNNTDACPNDPLKQAPGACGCGNVEVDTDGDSTPDCIDGCPNDPLKIAPLACGCGNAETDTDGDSTPDCLDGCPNDPLKTAAGQCGCGNVDTDSDSDGIADCVDNCPGVAGTIGSPCDDGDATTGNDALNTSCECEGQLIDCSGAPGGSALPGTACTTGGLPGIWNNSCVCELEGPDVAVQNVSAPNDTIAPDQTITLSWEVLNLGNAEATVNWTERYYMESGTGQNRVQLGQATHSSGTALAPSAMLSRSVQLVMPALINVGDEARFVVEIIPGTGLIELPNSATNNTGTQAQTWVVRKLIKLLVPQTSINEGSLAGIPIVVQRTGSIAAAQVVSIGIDESERFDFPPTLTILAGQSARSFTLVATENALLEGPIPAVLTASASGFLSATRNLTIIDNESPALSITGLPATTGEGTSVIFQVNTTFAPTAALQVFLTSSNQARFAVPASVTIQANTTTANVTVNLPQDQLPELDIDVTITAGAANHSPTTATFALTDDDVPGLALLLLTDTVSESAGAFAVQATLQRTAGSSPIAFTAQLSASLPNTLLLPASISLPANANQQTFTIGVVDNALVDDFRNVVINAAVQIAGCGCGAPPATAGNVNATLVVADNDGPSLSVSVNPATMAEGLANAGTLRVQRNTATSEALSVTLFSSDVNELTLPATVLIPIGANFLDVPITTVNDGTPDGSKQVYVQASAGGFSPGITWCIVTDVNQPDLIVTAMSASSSPWAALTTITWQATVANTGFANSIVGVPVRGVLSQNNSVDANDIILFDYTINTPIVAGSNVQISGAALVPNTPGTHKLLIQVNPTASVSELTYTNNTSAPLTVNIAPSYTALAQVAGTTFLRGTTIPITGTATRPDASPAANEPVEVYVLTNGLRREVLTTTDASGAFTASFVPLANESGHYTVGASFPGMQQTAEQDAFDIHGVRINNGQYPQFVTLIGEPLTGTLTIENLSNAPLTNLTLTPSNTPTGSNFSFSTIPTLAGGASATVTYEVSGTALSPGFNFQAGTLHTVSDQGTIQPQDFFYYCQAPGGLINASLSSINTTVSQAMGQQLVEFKVRNIGAGSTGALSLSLPQAPWLSAMTPVNMPALAPGDSALVILRFLAHASVPFDFPVNGTVVLNGANSNSLVIPFSFMKVSVTTGTLTVDAVNQFTFFDPAEPHVADASVEVRHAYSNALLASGTTDVNGLFTATNIPEGTHRLIVSKAQHLTYDQPVTINPGSTLNRTAFLNYQAISFNWNVVPTTVQDQYDVTLTMVFETNVPVPVVDLVMPDTFPQLFGNEVFAFNAVLTNHGLINALGVELLLPENDPEYEFITNYAPTTIPALSSIQVPVLMRVRQTPLMAGQENIDEDQRIADFLGIAGHGMQRSGFSCKLYTGTRWHYFCNTTTGLWERGTRSTPVSGRACIYDPTEPGGQPGDDGNGDEAPECPGCPPRPGGGYASNGLPITTPRRSCKDCLDKIGEALDECGVPYGEDITEIANCAAEKYAFGASGISAIAECAAQKISDNVLGQNGHTIEDDILDALDDAIDGALGKIPGWDEFNCVSKLIEAAFVCASTSDQQEGSGLVASRDANSPFQQAAEDLQAARNGIRRIQEMAEYQYGPIVLYDAWDDLFPLLEPFLLDSIPIDPASNASILSAVGSYDIPPLFINWFIQRWNQTMDANALGVYSPNATYPSMIDSVQIHGFLVDIGAALDHANARGYGSIVELYSGALSTLRALSTVQSNAVCASVTVQLSQTVTMTREAFRGTLDIFNGHPTDALDSLTVNIVIKNPDGVPSNGFFQINTEQLTNLSDVTGTGMIPAQEHGIVEFLFIPEIGAAPTAPVAYAFGGEVTYWDPFNEEMTSITLAPVTLTVNPSPNLMLHYFMERNILGDDALTSPEVEPSIPAELAVMVENDGFGPAVNMSISSAQPEIVENESGLAINFSLIGSNLQGQPAQLGVLNIPFGTIPPQSTRIGQWWFTSSLLGKFVSYEASVVHANSFGNPELSLIQGVELHELTHSIREYGPGSDGMNDFLVNDQFDINDRPDIIYFSQGNRTEEVLPAASGSFNAPVSAPTFTNTLTLEAAEEGWNYIKLNDPGNGNFDIVSVTRQDAQPIPLANAWLTFVTLPVSQPPVYEDKFHFVDKLATTAPTTYTVVWAPKNTDVPAIDTITGAPQTVTALQVTYLAVVFDKAIDPATFTVDDLTLTFQGGPNLMNNSAVITQVDAFTFNVDLSALTVGNGSYVFTAQAAGVTDIFGISGATGRQVSWTQYISVPAIVAFQGLPGGATDDAFTTIDLLFNLPIDPASFTQEDISITLNGIPQPGTLSVEQLSTTLFRVSGLGTAITSDGAHLFTVDMTGVLSAESEPGIQAQSTTLTRDNTGPVVAELIPLLTGGFDAQHRTGVRIRFSEPVVGLNTSTTSFTRDGQPIILNIAQLSQIDADEWQVTGFGLESYPDGDYLFAVSATGITDAIGNAGTGSLSTTWNVDRSAPIAVTGVNITPDLGISNSDGITSSPAFDALFNLNADAVQVTISQTSFGSEQVLVTLQNLASGAHAVPVAFPTGGNTGLKVTAIGANGGSASGTKSLFIDQAPLSASWQTANNQSLTNDLASASIQFSDAVLDPGAIQGALSLWKNSQPVSTASLTVTPVNATTYSIGGLPLAASGTGAYELRIDASVLNKSTSGISGDGVATLNWTVIPSYSATLRARVFLEGPYASGTMHDSLRNLVDFPLTEPFTALGYAHVGGGGESVAPQVLAITGNDAIVDWVLVELRDAEDNTEVVASRSALVQRDGDVVAVDGFSPVTMGIGAGAYHVAVRHRNHLGAMLADTARFYSGTTQVDFTLLTTPMHGTEAQKQIGARRALWAGDVNFDGMLMYVGQGNDRDAILVAIGGVVPTATTNGYLPSDVNLDGQVKYVGSSNDRDVILTNIGGVVPTNIREAQLPQP